MNPTKKRDERPQLVSKNFESSEEIDRGIEKLRRRIAELEQLDILAAVSGDSSQLQVARSNVRETIRAVFGQDSPEFREHEHIDIWGGPQWIGMEQHEILAAKQLGRQRVIGILNGLIGRMLEHRRDLETHGPAAPSTYLEKLNLNPRIADVARDLFMDGHHWEAVFAAAKALVNFVKERSGRSDLDGAP